MKVRGDSEAQKPLAKMLGLGVPHAGFVFKRVGFVVLVGGNGQL